MLKFYMDESGLGKNADERVCVVAGFVAQSIAWRGFQKQWRQILDDFQIDEFHSREFWQRRPDGGLVGKYKDWRFDRAVAFIDRLVSLLISYRPTLLASAIKVSDFLAYPLRERTYLTGGSYHVDKQKFLSTGKPSAAYFVPLQVVAIKGAELGLKRQQVCNFVFDEQNEYSSLALQRLVEMKTQPDQIHLWKYFGHSEFKNSAEALPLQCADLAAYCWKEFYKRVMYGVPLPDNDRAVVGPIEALTRISVGLQPNVYIFKLETAEMDDILRRSRLDDTSKSGPGTGN